MRPHRILSTFLLCTAAAQAALECVPATSTAPLRIRTPDDAVRLGSAVICPGATVTAIWSGVVVPPETIVVGAGSSLTITGSGVEAVADGKTLLRLFSVLEGGSLAVQGLTLRNGYSANQGGSVTSVANTTIKFEDAVLELSRARRGAAVFASGLVSLQQSILRNNSGAGECATCHGGAIYIDTGGSLTARDTTFEYNRYEGGQSLSVAAFGGAVYVHANDSVTSLSNCSFNANLSGSKAGALYAAGPLSMQSCSFTGNHLPARFSDGGAVCVTGSSTVISNCTFAQNWVSGNGGGIIQLGTGSFDVTDSSFDGNAAYGWGGAVMVETVGTFTKCAFNKNSATTRGGALFGAAKLDSCTFTENVITNQQGAATGEAAFGQEGAAVYVSEDSGGAARRSSAKNCSFVGNAVQGFGAAISVFGGAMDITGCRFEGNKAEYGALHIRTDLASTVTDTVFLNNTADVHGGAVFVDVRSSLQMQNCTFSGNAGGDGGAVASSGNLTLVSSQLTDNTAARGGGVAARAGSVTLRDVQFTRHTAQLDAGAVLVDAGAVADISDCQFSLCSAGRSGGAILLAGDGSVTASSFTGGSAVRGGGINTRGMARIENCTFSGGTFTNGGAGIYAGSKRSSQLRGPPRTTILQTVLHNNTAEAGAAVVCDVHSNVVMTACRLFNNTATTDGGALLLRSGGKLDMEECDLYENTATGPGGSIAADVGSELTVTSSSFAHSRAATGAAVQSAGVLQLTDVTVASCTAQHSGGAVHSTTTGSVTARNCTFSYNTVSDGSGGAVYSGSNATLQQSQFTGNTASAYGGAVFGEQDSSLAVSGSAFSHNAAGMAGGAVFAAVTNATNSSFAAVVSAQFLNSSASCCYAQGYSTSAAWASQKHTCADVDTGSPEEGSECCGAGFYTNGRHCVSCEGLFNCTAVGASAASITLLPGLWKAHRDSLNIYECWEAEACAGGRALQSRDEYCAPGYKGPYCAVCAAGYTRTNRYHCTACSGSYRAGAVVLFAVLMLLLLALFIYVLKDLAESGGEVSEAAGTAQSASAATPFCGSSAAGLARLPWSKLRVPLVVLQILTQYMNISGLRMPHLYTDFLSWIDVLNLNFGAIMNFACIVQLTFYQRLLINTLAPIAVLLLLVVTYSIAQRGLHGDSKAGIAGVTAAAAAAGTAGAAASSRMTFSARLHRVVTKHHTAFLIMTFLVYSTVSTVIFETFACDVLEPTKESFLRADYSVSCSTQQYFRYRRFAVCMVLLYPIGIPALYAARLWRARSAMEKPAAAATAEDSDDIDEQETAPLTDAHSTPAAGAVRSVSRKLSARATLQETKFLWKHYKPQAYYWEVVECCRRLLLTGFLVFIYPNTAAQPAVACILAVISMVAVAALDPLSDRTESRLYMMGCAVIFLSMFMSLLIRVDIAGESSESQALFSGVLIAMNLFIVAAAFGQIGMIAAPAFTGSSLQKLRRLSWRRASISSVDTADTVQTDTDTVTEHNDEEGIRSDTPTAGPRSRAHSAF